MSDLLPHTVYLGHYLRVAQCCININNHNILCPRSEDISPVFYVVSVVEVFLVISF